jgi:hypothetical protein
LGNKKIVFRKKQVKVIEIYDVISLSYADYQFDNSRQINNEICIILSIFSDSSSKGTKLDDSAFRLYLSALKAFCPGVGVSGSGLAGKKSPGNGLISKSATVYNKHDVCIYLH